MALSTPERARKVGPCSTFLSSWGYLALVLLTFAEAACVPIPSEVTLGYAGYLASTGRLDIALVIVLAVIGEFLGSFVGWSIGRFGGRPLVDKFGRYVLLTHSDLDRTERWFRKRGEPAVFFGRILPVVRTFISIPAGLAEMGLVRFGAATLCRQRHLVHGDRPRRLRARRGVEQDHQGFSAAGYVLVAVAVVVIACLHRAPLLGRCAASRRLPALARRPDGRAWLQPFGQWAVDASPEFGLTSRHDSSTATKSLAGICFIISTRAIGHCGKALPWKYQSLPLSASIRP